MSYTFQWNPFADQPHNVAPKKERFWHHFKHVGSYVYLVASNLRKAAPVLSLYQKYRKNMYKNPVKLEDSFALSVSPLVERNDRVVECLKETGVSKTLVRISSWEREKLDSFTQFFDLLGENKIEFSIALLQQREDVLNPSAWVNFLKDVFSRFKGMCSFFEVGHAWNRTKWGVWDYEEYLKLARPAVSLAGEYGVRLIGPAVIDFEFHLYPPVLEEVYFDRVSSLLYVDRVGAPESKQFGWNTPRKVALLKAVIDGCSGKERPLWITEVNWPLKGTGKYSPASGKPNVSEEEQASYLVRYFVPCLSGGLVERIYWWQLAAPGYGLIDNRRQEWRKRPSFYAFKTMVAHLRGSTFVGKMPHSQAQIFLFRSGSEDFAVSWVAADKEKTRPPFSEIFFPRRVTRVFHRDGQEIPLQGNEVILEECPKYIYFE